MSSALGAIKADLRKVETQLGGLHEAAAIVRDASPSHSEAKAEARRIANRIERALQQLEKIE